MSGPFLSFTLVAIIAVIIEVKLLIVDNAVFIGGSDAFRLIEVVASTTATIRSMIGGDAVTFSLGCSKAEFVPLIGQDWEPSCAKFETVVPIEIMGSLSNLNSLSTDLRIRFIKIFWSSAME